MKISSIVLQNPGSFQMQEMDLDTGLNPGDALLKVHRIGICGTDLHAYTGEQPFFTYPRILGHELGVEVVETGDDVENVEVGDYCAVEPYRYRPEDQAVKQGKPNCAEHMSVLGVHEDGGMRDYFTFPAKFLHPSTSLSLDQLALVEPLGIGCHAVNRAGVTADDTVVVIGAGPIGLGALQFALATGAKTCVMDIDEGRISFCRQQFDLAGTVNPRTEDVKDRLRSIFDGNLPSVILDATGNRQSMESTFDLIAHGGRIVYVGLFRGDVSFNDPVFHAKELTLLASRNAMADDFRQIIHSIEQGLVDTSPWITHRAPFNRVIDEFEHWLQPDNGVIKVMVHLD